MVTERALARNLIARARIEHDRARHDAALAAYKQTCRQPRCVYCGKPTPNRRVIACLLNRDLIGYELVITDSGPTPQRWRVTGSDNVLGPSYVQLRRIVSVNDDAAAIARGGMRVQNAGVVRRAMQLERDAA